MAGNMNIQQNLVFRFPLYYSVVFVFLPFFVRPISRQLLSVFQEQTSPPLQVVILSSSQGPTQPRKKLRLVNSTPGKEGRFA